MIEECQRCGDIDDDRRTLKMECFYDMNELNVPFSFDEKQHCYSLRVCKDCRADWMQAIEQWFHEIDSNKKSCGSGIFVRKFGASIEITLDEWNKMNPNKE